MFEVEIKALVEYYLATKTNLLNLGYNFNGKELQLNHYFNYDDYSLAYLFNNLRTYLTTEQELDLSNVIGKGNNFSIRTREINSKDTYFIIKYSVIDEDSANGTVRKELETKVNLNLDKLDIVLLDSGLSYSSKWSREREVFTKQNITATIDLNAGYGYLLELEILTNEDIELALSCINKELTKLQLKQLDSNLLNIMFKYYENNWNKYYGTNNYLWDDLEFYKYLVKQVF